MESFIWINPRYKDLFAQTGFILHCLKNYIFILIALDPGFFYKNALKNLNCSTSYLVLLEMSFFAGFGQQNYTSSSHILKIWRKCP